MVWLHTAAKSSIIIGHGLFASHTRTAGRINTPIWQMTCVIYVIHKKSYHWNDFWEANSVGSLFAYHSSDIYSSNEIVCLAIYGAFFRVLYKKKLRFNGMQILHRLSIFSPFERTALIWANEGFLVAWSNAKTTQSCSRSILPSAQLLVQDGCAHIAAEFWNIHVPNRILSQALLSFFSIRTQISKYDHQIYNKSPM